LTAGGEVLKRAASAVLSFALLAGCASGGGGGKIDPVAVAVGAVAVGEILSMIQVVTVPKGEPQQVDRNHSRIVFLNETNRALSITLEGPRTYDVSVGNNGEVSLIVEPGYYTARASAPATKTILTSYTFKPGESYHDRFYYGYEPH
jgi:hypothetical protein